MNPSSAYEIERPADSANLVAMLDGYLAAVVAHDPALADLAASFRETQNAVETSAGEGIWTTATALGPSVRYADPATSEAGYYGMVDEPDGPAITGLRVKVEDGSVSEAEWIIAREGMTFYNPAGFARNLPRSAVPEGSPPAERDAAIGAAKSYFNGIAAADGTLVRAHPDCYRVENGSYNVGSMPGQPRRTEDSPAGDGISLPLAPGVTSCITGFENLHSITEDVIDRRFFYDEHAGTVWTHGIFKRVPGARSRHGGPLLWLNFFELFQIDNDRIRGIYAAMNYLPAEITGSGWPGLE